MCYYCETVNCLLKTVLDLRTDKNFLFSMFGFTYGIGDGSIEKRKDLFFYSGCKGGILFW